VLPWRRVKKRKAQDGDRRVPLSDAALAVLDIQLTQRQLDDVFVFPAKNRSKPLSDATLQKMRERMKCAATPHGFRSSFRTWAAEKTSAQEMTMEAALAHRGSDKLERAYQRGDMFEKRRELMQAWGRFAKHGTLPALRLVG
jgi:integrase